MKKIILILLSFALLNVAVAMDTANLRMKISGVSKTSRYFLCIPQMGCVNMLAGNAGKVFTINPGNVNNIILLDMDSRQMHVQSLPASCHTSVNEKQTIKVNANLVIKNQTNQKILKNLRCQVS